MKVRKERKEGRKEGKKETKSQPLKYLKQERRKKKKQ